MKTVLPCLLVLLLAGCQTGDRANTPVPKPTHQMRLQAKLDRMAEEYSAAPNDVAREEVKKMALDTAWAFIRDTLKYEISNADVTMNEFHAGVKLGINALYATFSDEKGNKYFTEFDYDVSDDSSIKKNPAYAVLKNLPQGQKIKLSFFCIDKEWDDDSFGSFPDLKLQVVPFPENFNFDSSRKINAPIEGKRKKKK